MRALTPRPSLFKNALLFSSVLYDLWLRFQDSAQVSHSIEDPFQGDAGNGQSMLAGRVRLGVHMVHADFEPALFLFKDAPLAWHVALHSFNWLADLKEIEQDIGRRVAQTMVLEWLKRYDVWSAFPWHTEIIAQRVVSWIFYADFLLEGADSEFRQRFTSHIGRQVRHLSFTAGDLPHNPTRIHAYAALVIVSLVCKNYGHYYNNAFTKLVHTLGRQIRSDGSHISRRPDAGVECLTVLLRLNVCFETLQLVSPREITDAIVHLARFIRFFQLEDHTLVPFHGGGAETFLRINPLLRLCPPQDALPRTMGGYYRINVNRITIFIDGDGAPAQGTGAYPYASLGALHICTQKYRLISSCTSMAFPFTCTDLHQLSALEKAMQYSAAHSVVDFIGYDNLSLVDDEPCGVVHSLHEQDGHTLVSLSHQGYSALGYDIERFVYVSPEGDEVRGEDVITGKVGAQEYDYAIRFHLYPNIKVSFLDNDQSALLTPGSGQSWIMHSGSGKLVQEKSIYIMRDGVHRQTSQLIIYGRACPGRQINKWGLRVFNKYY